MNSSSTCVWTLKPNQLGYGQTFENVTATETQPAHMIIQQPTLDGTVYIAQCKSTTADASSVLPFVEATDLTELKTKTPGINMRRLYCTKYTASRGVSMKSTYTPKNAFGYKDLQDNLEALQFQADVNPLRGAYNATSMFRGQKILPPDASNPDPTISHNVPLFECEVQINYNIMFYRRKNHIGANTPIGRLHPHDEM
jgi:hypothetical protein